MDTAAFDYDLPEARIAQHPVEPRDAARLLVDTLTGADHRHVHDLPELLDPGDLLVVNTTRVLPARLRLRQAHRGSGRGAAARAARPGHVGGPGAPGRRVPPGTVLHHPASAELLTGHRR